MTHWVYELVSPTDNSRFYIGITGCPHRRYEQHLAGKCLSTKGFISKLVEQPLLRTVAEFPSLKEAHDLEQALIRESTRSKIPLCNNRYGRDLHPSTKNHGSAWDESQRRRVRELHESGASIDAIALNYGPISLQHIDGRCVALGSRPKPDSVTAWENAADGGRGARRY